MQPRVEAVETCPLSPDKGRLVYANLPDRFHGVPGRYNIYWCDTCQLAWLNPRPIREDVGLCYPQAYYTHEPPFALQEALRRPSRWDSLRKAILHSWFGYPRPEGVSKTTLLLGRVLGAIPSLRKRAYYSLKLRLPWTGEGRLLDVGCGSGMFLLYMRALGWQVVGVDIDAQAVEACRQVGLTAYAGTLEEQRFPEASFDAITMSHVIEHISDPLRLLQECYRILKPGGYLGIVTPNWESLGHKWFMANWYALEVPRHFVLFTLSSLQAALRQTGFHINKAQTLVDKWMAHCIYGLSTQYEKFGRAEGPVSPLKMRLFELVEKSLHSLSPKVGEELLIVAQKPK